MKLRLHFPLIGSEQVSELLLSAGLSVRYRSCVLGRTVSSPDLLKGHQPLALFCWKMEIFSVPSVIMSALHDFADFAPRGKLWRSSSTVPTHTHTKCTHLISQIYKPRNTERQRSGHTPRKSSEESVSKSQTCRMRMAGSFCSVLSREKILSLFFTTTTCERQTTLSASVEGCALFRPILVTY